MNKPDYLNLVKELNHYSDLYYNKNESLIPDEEYDKLYRSLIETETLNPSWVTPLSPSQKVGYKINSNLPKIVRDVKMRSLDNIFDSKELHQWLSNLFSRITKVDTNNEYDLNEVRICVEPKYDGLSISLVYEDGVLVQASTRGDGLVGENVLANVVHVNGIPKYIDEGKVRYLGKSFEVRGEIYVNYQDFEKVNDKLKQEGKPLFKHPRNYAAGSLRQLDPNVTKQRNLSFSAYALIPDKDATRTHVFTHDSQLYTLSALRQLGFNVSNESFRVHGTLDDISEHIELFKNKRDTLPYPIDGVVLKVDNIQLQELLGFNERSPNWAIAYKLPATILEAKVLNMIPQVGRFGTITPVIIIEDVNIDGVNVSRVTAHNYTLFKNLNITVQDTVYISRSGDVIPFINGVRHGKDHGKFIKKYNLSEINNCPSCKSPTVLKGKYLYCSQPSICNDVIVQRIIYGVSRNCLNIIGLGDEYVRYMVEPFKLVNCLADIFMLTEKDYIKAIGDANGRKIYQAVQDILLSGNRAIEFAKVIAAAGVAEIGLTTSEKLSRYCTTKGYLKLEEVFTKGIEEFFNPNSKTYANIKEYLDDEKVKRDLEKLYQVPFNIEYPVINNEVPDNIFKGKRFVITGSFSDFSRQEIVSKIVHDLGGIEASSVTKNIDYIIVGKNPGSKLDKAIKLSIPILEEAELLAILAPINKPVKPSSN